jgi:UDP-N-acetylglucosamine 2-epimerase
MKVTSIVGARPQFAKAAMLSRALATRGHDEVLIHTGQHYDDLLSGVFFRELQLRPPDVNLGVGSASQGVQTARMIEGLEQVLIDTQPDVVAVFGDTNSTLAGALAAAKLGLPLAHVEAGFRSYNRSMPEEINRVVTDHVATHLFCATQHAVECLRREGLEHGVHFTGDVMYDSLRAMLARTEESAARSMKQRGLEARGYYLATVHRPANTDDPAVLRSLIGALGGLDAPVVFPMHPRTRDAMKGAGIEIPSAVQIEEPVGYIEMLALEMNARTVLTDSGGVQREAYFLKVPCVTLREDTEWPELLETGWNVLAGCDPESIIAAAKRPRPAGSPPPLFGDGNAAEKIVEIHERDPPDR